MAAQFPQAGSHAWTRYQHANENKLGMAKRELFPPVIAAATEELKAMMEAPNSKRAGAKRPARAP